ncbi:ABC transporter permease [uncultured Microbacterium sp.]|uniref:ABC transporter permease n=1 Tax=uncultured Microbacterium sp. TaxID=191216 RepID=UPI0035CC0D83
MYWTYLWRELAGRKRQTAIVAVGLAIAIALVIIVNSLAAGVRDAQAQALESVYGVGTDLTVTGAAATPGQAGGAQFDFRDGEGQSADGTTTLSQSRLRVERMRGTLPTSTVDTVTAIDGVGAASGALSLTNVTFSGQVPTRSQGGTDAGTPRQGGPGGAGGSSFDLNSFTVLGIDPSDSAIGPLASVTLSEGRALTADDDGQNVAVLDATYASTNSLAVGGTIDVGGTTMQIVGIVASSTSADSAANVYLPLDVAQTLSGAGDVVSTVYVQASSSSAIDSVQSALQTALPDATVSSESELAASVSGSLSSASTLITNLGTWLSIIVLAVAVLLAVLFTISGVSRRTREFGTLKAIGWSDGRVVGQVAGESMVQGVIGGAVGLVIGLIGIWIINISSPTISATTTAATTGRGAGRAGGAGGFGGGGPGGFAQTASDVVLHAPISVWVIAAAIGLAILGGLVAGAFGGWRAARLRPAEALRSVS